MIKIQKCYKGCYNVFFNNKYIFEIVDANSEGKVFDYSLWNVIEDNNGRRDADYVQGFNSFKDAKEYAIKEAEKTYNLLIKEVA